MTSYDKTRTKQHSKDLFCVVVVVVVVFCFFLCVCVCVCVCFFNVFHTLINRVGICDVLRE